jgi:hypothetical protein
VVSSWAIFFVKDPKYAFPRGGLEYLSPPRYFRRHDPKGIVAKHCELFVASWSYSHKKWEDGVFLQDANDWEEVLERRRNLQLTIFKTLSSNEHLVDLERRIMTEKAKK